MYLAIAGNIGSGKSSLTALLSEAFGLKPVYEAVSENPYLEDFYREMGAYAFHSQVFFLARRVRQHLLEVNGARAVVQDRTVYEDALVFAQNLYREGHLKDPRTGKEPFAVVQLRQEDKAGRMWSLVGFQTGLKWPEQKRLIQMIPGLENAEIVRYGVMHRNTYLNAPLLLQETLEFKEQEGLFAAGVLAGVEGYLESAATGFLAGLNAARRYRGLKPVAPPEESMLGGLVRFLATANPKGFQPMYANWGLVPPVEGRMAKKEKREAMYHRGLRAFEEWVASLGMLAST